MLKPDVTKRVLAAALLCSAAGCGLVLGLDKDYHAQATGTGGGTSSSTTGTGGGTSSSTTGTGGGQMTSSGTTSTGTSDGSAPCRLLHDMEDCGAGMRCTILNANTGTTKCVPVNANHRDVWDGCADDGVCPAGTWCDGRTKVCMPFCEGSSECGKGSCVSAANSIGKDVPGAKVCTAHCDPVSADPCGVGTNCVQDASLLDFDCSESGGSPIGGICSSDKDCDKGGACTASNSCVQWCTPVGGFPPEYSNVCSQFANGPVNYNGKSYGYCQ